MLSSSLPPDKLQKWLLRNPSTSSLSTAAGSMSSGEGEHWSDTETRYHFLSCPVHAVLGGLILK